MKDYISIGGQIVHLSAEQVEKIMAENGITIQRKTLAECAARETVKIGGFEMVVLEQREGETSLILKDTYGDETTFGNTNHYDGSNVDKRCQEFAKELEDLVGAENIIPHEVDLVSNDGLKCYGKVTRRASSITADMYRKFVDILDTVNPEKWWWLATPWSTKRHDGDRWNICVAPSGNFYCDCYGYGVGVRPFCILKSSIFVSA